MAKGYDCLFRSLTIGKVKIKNRIGMAPMSIFGLVSADGCFTQRGIDYYVERAKGGAGLIITGYSEIENDVEVSLNGVVQNTSLNPPRFISSACEMTERVHAYGAKIFLQITLGLGRVGYAPWISCRPIAPSAIPNFWNPQEICREISIEEIQTLINKAVEAAKTAKQSGFDGVEIHAVHEGYLLDQFALSVFNRRTDKYGGDLKGRLSFATEIVQEIKKHVGHDFPVVLRYSVKSFIKDWNNGALPGEEFLEKGRDINEGIEAAKILEEAGYDALDADCGTYEGFYWAHPPGYFDHGCYLPYVEKLKEAIKIPILMAGRMEIPDLAEKAVAEGKVDMVLLGRGLLAEPYWPVKVRTNQINRIRPCLGCHDGCLGREDLCKPISCAVNPACGREVEYAVYPALKKKKIMIAGGGIAGMEAARIAAQRGHKVTIYEKTHLLGGHLIEASVPDFKDDEKRLLAWYQNELAELDVNICFGKEVTQELIEAEKPDAFIVATGSTPKVPQIPGIKHDSVLTACQILLDKNKAGENIVIIGGGLVGCEVALWLGGQQNKKVTIIEVLDDLMSTGEVPFANKQMLRDLLKLHKINVLTGTSVTQIGSDHVQIIDQVLNKESIVADNVVLAVGYQSSNKLYEIAATLVPETSLIGDAREAKNIMSAIWDAYEIARGI